MKTFKNTVSIEGLGQNPHAIFDTLHLDTLDQIGITNVTPGNGGWSLFSSHKSCHAKAQGTQRKNLVPKLQYLSDKNDE